MTRKPALLLTAVAVTGAALTAAAPAADAVEVPEHAIIVCQDATMYENYDFSIPGPVHPIRTLTYGDKVGHTRGKHPVYNGWASIQDFGPNDWGFVRIECLGGWGSW
ncbi:hypothetical protein [Kribbella jiaozuonensis]|uniref:SH3 domain-containing protein n=1 Tax=Kribbella jiaozuonensis TaxID=2575441 RepID=A0A4U3M355_9ACTN|nr:hypothetical protein [Kribbella jiaozuonensis]TKK79118.1 hypothetical protein FDA38_11845 [Kribbella jiaozuonensis]TKK83188.1 hypothetical protein FDA38_10800 [Kribbella jiaozuonensis]